MQSCACLLSALAVLVTAALVCPVAWHLYHHHQDNFCEMTRMYEHYETVPQQDVLEFFLLGVPPSKDATSPGILDCHRCRHYSVKRYTDPSLVSFYREQVVEDQSASASINNDHDGRDRCGNQWNRDIVLPVLYIHGNAGSEKQVRSFGKETTLLLHHMQRKIKDLLQQRLNSAAQNGARGGKGAGATGGLLDDPVVRGLVDVLHGDTQGAEKRGTCQRKLDVHFYAIDFLGEESFADGAVMQRQAWYTSAVLQYLARKYPSSSTEDGRAAATVTGLPIQIIAHSMGGVVMRLALTQLARKHMTFVNSGITASSSDRRDTAGAVYIGGAITLGTPHTVPVVRLSGVMDSLYAELRASELWTADVRYKQAFQQLFDHCLISLAGGERDVMVRTPLTRGVCAGIQQPTGRSGKRVGWVRGGYDNVCLDTAQMPAVGFPVDHLALLWCRQISATVAKHLVWGALTSVVPASDAEAASNSKELARNSTWCKGRSLLMDGGDEGVRQQSSELHQDDGDAGGYPLVTELTAGVDARAAGLVVKLEAVGTSGAETTLSACLAASFRIRMARDPTRPARKDTGQAASDSRAVFQVPAANVERLNDCMTRVLGNLSTDAATTPTAFQVVGISNIPDGNALIRFKLREGAGCGKPVRRRTVLPTRHGNGERNQFELQKRFLKKTIKTVSEVVTHLRPGCHASTNSRHGCLEGIEVVVDTTPMDQRGTLREQLRRYYDPHYPPEENTFLAVFEGRIDFGISIAGDTLQRGEGVVGHHIAAGHRRVDLASNPNGTPLMRGQGVYISVTSAKSAAVASDVASLSSKKRQFALMPTVVVRCGDFRGAQSSTASIGHRDDLQGEDVLAFLPTNYRTGWAVGPKAVSTAAHPHNIMNRINRWIAGGEIFGPDPVVSEHRGPFSFYWRPTDIGATPRNHDTMSRNDKLYSGALEHQRCELPVADVYYAVNDDYDTDGASNNASSFVVTVEVVPDSFFAAISHYVLSFVDPITGRGSRVANFISLPMMWVLLFGPSLLGIVARRGGASTARNTEEGGTGAASLWMLLYYFAALVALHVFAYDKERVSGGDTAADLCIANITLGISLAFAVVLYLVTLPLSYIIGVLFAIRPVRYVLLYCVPALVVVSAVTNIRAPNPAIQSAVLALLHFIVHCGGIQFGVDGGGARPLSWFSRLSSFQLFSSVSVTSRFQLCLDLFSVVLTVGGVLTPPVFIPAVFNCMRHPTWYFPDETSSLLDLVPSLMPTSLLYVARLVVFERREKRTRLAHKHGSWRDDRTTASQTRNRQLGQVRLLGWLLPPVGLLGMALFADIPYAAQTTTLFVGQLALAVTYVAEARELGVALDVGVEGKKMV